MPGGPCAQDLETPLQPPPGEEGSIMPIGPYPLVLTQLLDQVPELEERYWAHQTTYERMSTYSFMSEIEDWIQHLAHQAVQTGEPVAADILGRLFRFVEEALSATDPEVPNLMAVGLLERIVGRTPTFPLIWSQLGPKAQQTWEALQVALAGGAGLPRLRQQAGGNQAISSAPRPAWRPAEEAWQPEVVPEGPATKAALQAAYAQGQRDFRSWDLHGLRLGRCDLRQADLQGVNLARADLVVAKLQDATLAGADLRGARLTSANLLRADLTGANLTGALLVSTYLSDACLREARLKEVRLRGAILSGVDGTGVDLHGLRMVYVEFHGAILQRANLAGSTLVMANFAQADLREADLAQADLTYADLRGADLRGANLQGAILRRANLLFATLDKPQRAEAKRAGAIVPEGA